MLLLVGLLYSHVAYGIRPKNMFVSGHLTDPNFFTPDPNISFRPGPDNI